jgi:hypothetical protein
MDWGQMANVAAVVFPSVAFVGWLLDTKAENRQLRNNDDLLKRINGTYMKSEIQKPLNEELHRKIEKVERDMGHLTSSYGRMFRPGPINE